MSINKKTFLGKTPVELGMKDAIHVAIVSLRASRLLQPGIPITLTEDGEAVGCSRDKAFGMVDPFLTEPVIRGQNFWAVMYMDEIPNVRHSWDHPQFGFTQPTCEAKQNRYLLQIANELKVTYEQLFDALDTYIDSEISVSYPGSLSEDELEEVIDNLDSDMWVEWAEETGYEFENYGKACCPEVDYPSKHIFHFIKES